MINNDSAALRSSCCNETLSRPGHKGPWSCDNCRKAFFTTAQATEIFIEKTETDDISAWAWLPSEYDHCDKCDSRETHDHPTKALITPEELDQAINENLQSQLETYLDC